jgi:hypothetical protein
LIIYQCKNNLKFFKKRIAMKNIKKISILMAIFTAGHMSHLIARPGMQGGSTHESGSSDHNIDPSKAIAGKALIGPGGKSGKSDMGGMAMMAGMASQDSDDSGGSGSSGGSGGSGAPTTPTTPTTPPPADLSGQQYAAAPNTGVPTSTPSAASSPTTATTPDASTTAPDKAATDKSEHKDKDKKTDTDKNKEHSVEEDQKNIIEDQGAILEKIKEINVKDDRIHYSLSQASMDLLFNNFVYFKDFIVTNFTKDKMLTLCTEFINQIYPNEHVKVISMNNSEIHAPISNSENQEQEQSSDRDQMMQPSHNENQMPQEMPEQSPDQMEEPTEIPQPMPDHVEQHEDIQPEGYDSEDQASQ